MSKTMTGLLVASLALLTTTCGPRRTTDVARAPAGGDEAGAPETPAAGDDTTGAASSLPPTPPPTPMPTPMPMPLSIPAFSGVRDWSPTFLGEGATVLWLRQEDCAVYLRTALPPYGAVASNHRLADDSCELNRMGVTLATADGRHAFVALGDDLYHLVLEDGVVQREEPVPEADFSMNLAAGADGSRLFSEVDGPRIEDRNPGWRAVGLFTQEDGGWMRTLLTEAAAPRIVELVGARGDGRAVLYDEGSTDQWGTPERIVFAEGGGAGSGPGSGAGAGSEWRHDVLDFGDVALHPRALAADGTAMLLQGFPRELGGERSGFNLYLAYAQAGTWGRAALMVRDEPRASIYVPGMSPDAKQIFWEHYTRNVEDGAIVRSEVRMIAAREVGWTEPAVVFSRDDYFQIDRLAFNGRGQAVFDAWSRAEADDRRFIIHAYVAPDVGDAGKLVSLSDLGVSP
jgi:hypothetical protein